jgi:hypothetical protein
MVRRDIRFGANMKRIFIRFKANKTGFIRLFRIEANQRIFTCQTSNKGSEYSLLSENFIYFASKRIY